MAFGRRYAIETTDQAVRFAMRGEYDNAIGLLAEAVRLDLTSADLYANTLTNHAHRRWRQTAQRCSTTAALNRCRRD